MRIYLTWDCRECGKSTRLHTDTSNYGVLASRNDGTGNTTFDPQVVDLKCTTCAHVSGEVGLGYRYRASHRPSHEREEHRP